ncbi:hypothetical protein B9Z19DRAFT_804344 [Tuber borchii]|uniref:Uncharacterized protein n=1 Tax=Tuber borchii TaxID=42251 RepID=A0A2T6ZW03_TUBBO|nr:hypothetical protein B9Z19DRAFT_804344 [Tuber borchii]
MVRAFLSIITIIYHPSSIIIFAMLARGTGGWADDDLGGCLLGFWPGLAPYTMRGYDLSMGAWVKRCLLCVFLFCFLLVSVLRLPFHCVFFRILCFPSFLPLLPPC